MIKARSKMDKTIAMLSAAGKGESDQVFAIIESEDVEIGSTDELKRSPLHVRWIPVPYSSLICTLCSTRSAPGRDYSSSQP